MPRGAAWHKAYLLLDPAAPGLIPSVPEIISEGKIVDAPEVNQWCCLEESVLRLENVFPTDLELTIGKLELKRI